VSFQRGIAERRQDRNIEAARKARAAGRAATASLRDAEGSVDRAERALWKVAKRGEEHRLPVERAVEEARRAARMARGFERRALGAARQADVRGAVRAAGECARAADVARRAEVEAERER
jgi:hypothetical protein